MTGLSRTTRFSDLSLLPPLPSTPPREHSPSKSGAFSSRSDHLYPSDAVREDRTRSNMLFDVQTPAKTYSSFGSPSKREPVKIVSPIPKHGSIHFLISRTPSPRGPRTSLGSVDLNDVSYGHDDQLGDITIDSIPLSTPLRIGRATLDIPSSTRSSRTYPTPPSVTRGMGMAKSRSTSGSSLHRIAEDQVASVPFSKRSPEKRMAARYTPSDRLGEASPATHHGLDRSMSVSELLADRIQLSNRVSPVKRQTSALDRSMSITDLLAQGSRHDRALDRSLSVHELMAQANPPFLDAVPEPSEIDDVSFTVNEPGSPFLPPRVNDFKLALPLPTPSRTRKAHRRSLSQGALPEGRDFEWASKKTTEIPLSKRSHVGALEPSPAPSRLARADLPPLSPRSRIPETPTAPAISRFSRTLAVPTPLRARVPPSPGPAPASPRIRAPLSSARARASSSAPVPTSRVPRVSVAPPVVARARPVPALTSQGLPSARAATNRPVSVTANQTTSSRVANLNSHGLPLATSERPMRAGGSVGRFKPSAPTTASAGTGRVKTSSSNRADGGGARELSRLGLPLASGLRSLGSKASLPARPFPLGESSGSGLNGERESRERPKSAKPRIGSTPARLVSAVRVGRPGIGGEER